VIGRNVGQDETDDLIVTPAAGEIAAFASDLSEHFRLLSIDPHLTLLCHVGNAEVVNESAWVQLCGPFAVEFSGRRIDNLFPGRQGRLLFAYLTLSRLQAVSRETLMEVLWGDARPANAAGALSALISKTRAVVGADVLRAYGTVLDPPRAGPCRCGSRPVPTTFRRICRGSGRLASGMAPGLSALFVARRTFLPEAEAWWAEPWRRRLADVRLRALERYAQVCLGLGGAELPGAERAGRELVDGARSVSRGICW
jgi:hypothetical protein